MSIKQCRKCKAAVNELANMCPSCGEPNPTQGMSTPIKLIIGFIVVVVIVQFFNTNSIPNDANTSTSPSSAISDARYITENEARVTAKLKDPESAQFRDVYVSNSFGIPLVCGEVNAKNSFGGYTGYQRFISGGELQVIETDMAAGEMDKSWVKFCKRN